VTQNGTLTDRAQGFVRGSGVGSVKGRQETTFLELLVILLSCRTKSFEFWTPEENERTEVCLKIKRFALIKIVT
jgi:hypothetical protein